METMEVTNAANCLNLWCPTITRDSIFPNKTKTTHFHVKPMDSDMHFPVNWRGVSCFLPGSGLHKATTNPATFRQTNASPTTAVYQLTHRANMYDYSDTSVFYTSRRSAELRNNTCLLSSSAGGGWLEDQPGRKGGPMRTILPSGHVVVCQVPFWLVQKSYECVLGHGFDTDQLLNDSYIHQVPFV